MNHETLVFNLQSNSVRRDTFSGEEYLVVPMAMLGPGVFQGSAGPLLYTEEELAKAPNLWNMRPITLSHPSINGEPRSGCDPSIFNEFGLGYVMNTKFQRNKLRAEAWLNVKLCEELAPELIANLEAGNTIEVSTGMFANNEETSGKHSDGKDYTGIVRDIQPDHLAVLMESRGAYSIADGGGLLQLNEAGFNVPNILTDAVSEILKRHNISNEMGHNQVHQAIYSALNTRFGADKEKPLWIEEIYDSFVIFNYGEDLKKIGYKKDDGSVTLDDKDPVKVKRVTEYRTIDGAFVGNADHSQPVHETKEITMDKDQFVADLIANESTQWGEDDRTFLMDLTEDQLTKFTPIVNETKEEKPSNGTTSSQETTVVANSKKTEVPSLSDYINGAPAEIREVLNEALSSNAEERGRLVKAIMNHERNQFTEEDLRQRPMNDLRNIASLLGDTGSTGTVRDQVMNFAGRAGATPKTGVINNEEPMVAPTMDYETAN